MSRKNPWGVSSSESAEYKAAVAKHRRATSEFDKARATLSGGALRVAEDKYGAANARMERAYAKQDRRFTKEEERELEAASRRARNPKRNAPTPHGTTYKFYPITLNDYGYYIVPKIDKDTWFDTIPEAKKHIDWWEKRKRNPSEAYRAGVSAMKSAAARYGTTNLTPSIAQREEWRHAWGEFMKGWKAEAKRPNPAAEAAEAYTDFHGRPSEEVVTVKTEIHYHKHLAACGELRKLKVKPVGKLFTVSLSDFRKAFLAFNENRTQLFIEGGDQTVDLKQFGIKQAHEVETLGEVKVIEYYTIKDHLGSEGGQATYVHKFAKPYPVLIYNVLDKQLTFSGGSYKVLAEGIDK